MLPNSEQKERSELSPEVLTQAVSSAFQGKICLDVNDRNVP